MRWLLAILLIGGCAAGGVDRYPRASATGRAYAFDGVILHATPRAGQLSASREWERNGGSRVIRADDGELRNAFRRDLGRALPLDPNAPLRLRTWLTLQDTGYFEGLATETADVTLVTDVVDAEGNLLRTIRLRESASAPLQRSASRKARLEAAFTRLTQRLAAEL